MTADVSQSKNQNIHGDRFCYTWIEYSLPIIQNNFRVFSNYVSPAKCAAVLKSNAYGVGAPDVATALYDAGCRLFFVAYIDEADAIAKALYERRGPTAVSSYEPAHGDDYNIFILDGPLLGKDWCADFFNAKFIPVLNTLKNVREWNAYAESQVSRGVHKTLPAVLFVDTGLHRLGVPHDEFFADFSISKTQYVEWRCFMSHFVASSDSAHPANAIQIAKVAKIRETFPSIPFSLSDTAGALLGKHTHHDIVRVGMGLYGLHPYIPGIEQAIAMYSRVLQTQRILPGDGVGYDWAFVAKEQKQIATVACGYADGVRQAPSAALCDFYIRERKAPILGRAAMDLTIVDVTGIDGVEVGDPVVVLGYEGQLQNVSSGETLLYRTLTGMGNRVRRVSAGKLLQPGIN
jgi:alanine racemase